MAKSKEFEWSITPHDCGRRRQIFVEGYRKADGTEVKSYCRKKPSHRGKYETFEGPTGFQETKRKLTRAEAERRRSEYAQMTHTSEENYSISEFMYEDD